MYTIEYDMYEFGLAERFNYAEMAALIAPRPFQVERGHDDGVAPDEWIGYEYAKVKRLYDTLGLADRVDIAYFNGGHKVDGRGRSRSWPGTWTGRGAAGGGGRPMASRTRGERLAGRRRPRMGVDPRIPRSTPGGSCWWPATG